MYRLQQIHNVAVKLLQKLYRYIDQLIHFSSMFCNTNVTLPVHLHLYSLLLPILVIYYPSESQSQQDPFSNHTPFTHLMRLANSDPPVLCPVCNALQDAHVVGRNGEQFVGLQNLWVFGFTCTLIDSAETARSLLGLLLGGAAKLQHP